MAQVHILTGPERRRTWSEEQKRTIVAATFAPGALVSHVARQADVHPSLVYRWRRDLRLGPTGFSEVVVAPASAPSVEKTSAIEVGLADGTRVHIPTNTPPELAAAVLRALRR
ncbi:IS66-like element accessory protein TnpA [Shumkonia mesophila]|uniref:IS66-like element accessory protein TnpA n=1 Tax=Shumkonia mesophila TaxID=2838854 RepID=UPI002934246D|nr:transposase [Shumkonia mesophila]